MSEHEKDWRKVEIESKWHARMVIGGVALVLLLFGFVGWGVAIATKHDGSLLDVTHGYLLGVIVMLVAFKALNQLILPRVADRYREGT